MYRIYFSNSKATHDHNDRFCETPEHTTAWCVYDALCVKYLHVTLVKPSGDIDREYCNIY